MKLGIVILNYNNYNQTIDCLNCLRMINGFGKCFVVVIDNCSPNDSLKCLADNIHEKNVSLIKNIENTGYAQGNNLGYAFLKNNHHCDTIMIMNSDVKIEDLCFFERIEKTLPNHLDSSVLAPDIVNLSGIHSNPFGLIEIDKKNIRKIILKNKIKYMLIKCNIKAEKKRRLKTESQNSTYLNTESAFDGIFVPHGSCLIFTPTWVSKENKCFFSRTFLFCEENILEIYIREVAYRMTYVPQLKVIHLEDGSMNSISEKNKEKELFVIKNQIASLCVLKKFLKNPLKAWNEVSSHINNDFVVIK